MGFEFIAVNIIALTVYETLALKQMVASWCIVKSLKFYAGYLF